MDSNVLQQPSASKKIDLNKFDLHARNIMQKLINLKRNGIMCDITLVAGDDNVKIRAHRTVLIGASDYFEKMLTGAFKESVNEEITLEGIKGETLDTIIDWCYDGCADINEKTFVQIVRLSDKYGISSLLLGCLELLKNIINNENCIDFFQLTDLSHLVDFTQYIIQYVIENFEKIRNSKNFCNLSVDAIKKILSSDQLCVSSEEDVFDALKFWIDNDFENRKKHLTELLPLVRMPLLKPMFIRKSIHPLIEKTNEYTLGALIMESFMNSVESRTNLSVKLPNPRNMKENLLVLSKIPQQPIKVYCYSPYTKKLKWVKYLDIDQTFVAIYNDKLICTKNLDSSASSLKKLQLLSIHTAERVTICESIDLVLSSLVVENDLFVICSNLQRNQVAEKEYSFKKFSLMNKKCTNLQLFCPKFERTFMVKVDQNNIHFLFGEKNIIKSMCHYNISSTEWSQPLEIVQLTIICWPVAMNGHIYVVAKDENEIRSLIKINVQTATWHKEIILPNMLSVPRIINLNNSIILVGKVIQANYVIFKYEPILINWIKLNDINFDGNLVTVKPISSRFLN